MKRHQDGYLVKLVRDRIGELLGAGTIAYRRMPHDEHVRRLRRKLVEEAAEYAVEPSIDELAQVIVAVHALAEIDLGVTYEAVTAHARREVVERGGFACGLGMYAHHPAFDGPASTPPIQADVGRPAAGRPDVGRDAESRGACRACGGE